MLPNEEFALACLAYYEEQGLIVDATNGQFAHCPLPRSMGETGYYLLWGHHQHQGLLQSRDLGKRCFWAGHTKQWLQQCDYFPDGYFELWDIYEEFAKPAHDLSYLRSPEIEQKRIENSLKAQTPEVRKRQGESLKKAYREGRKIVPPKCHEHKVKPVEITLPSGKVGSFPSIKLAAMFIGCFPETVVSWCNGGRSTKPYKGYSARFV